MQLLCQVLQLIATYQINASANDTLLCTCLYGPLLYLLFVYILQHERALLRYVQQAASDGRW
jgi:hypothetical protein